MRVIAKQFDWVARYPGADGIFGSNRLDLVSSENPMGIDKSDPAAKDDVLAEGKEMAVPVNKPVIAVPTSIGYGASFGGIAALLAMLNSCGSGLTVVNIDNGFGAGYAASQINALAAGELE